MLICVMPVYSLSLSLFLYICIYLNFYILTKALFNRLCIISGLRETVQASVISVTKLSSVTRVLQAFTVSGARLLWVLNKYWWIIWSFLKLCLAATQQVRFSRQTRMWLRITERSQTSSNHNMPCCTGNMSNFFAYVILGLGCYIKLGSFRALHVTFNCRRDSPLWEKTPANQEAGGKYKEPIQYPRMDRGYRWMTHTYSRILLKNMKSQGYVSCRWNQTK